MYFSGLGTTSAGSLLYHSSLLWYAWLVCVGWCNPVVKYYVTVLMSRKVRWGSDFEVSFRHNKPSFIAIQESWVETKWMSDSKSVPMSWLQTTCYVTSPSKVIRGNMTYVRNFWCPQITYFLWSISDQYWMFVPSLAVIYLLRSTLRYPFRLAFQRLFYFSSTCIKSRVR